MPGGTTNRAILGAATLSVLALVLLAVACVWAAAASAMYLPPEFQARDLPLPEATSPTWTDGLQKPTTVDFAPDGKMFVAERNGFVLEFDSIEDPTPTLVLAITDKVLAAGDRGLLGMKLDPEYPTEPFVYLSYTYDAPIGGDSDDSTHTHNADGSDSCDETNFSIDCLASGRLARVEINPATSVAVGGPVDPSSEQVLVNSWCQQVTSHSIGDIEFDSSGALLMSGGDGASWGSIDYGQLGNPCNDPPYEGGSLRAQDLRTPATPGDPTDYSGSVIRVDRETGAALVDNPFSVNPLFGGGVEDVAAKRVLANGLRNPYRFTLRPGSGEIYVGDVGQDLWEEINRFTLPGPGVNFGWPCYEGGPAGSLQMPRWKTAEGETHKPLCEALYNNPSSVKAPFFAYPHKNTPGYDGSLFLGDACKPQAGSAVAGLAFYEDAGVPVEDAFPAAYDGALFFSDAARGCIWTMEAGAGGAPDPSTVANFLVHEEDDPVFTPVDVVAGPDGALYIPNFYGNSIVQIQTNKAPTAKLDIVEGSTYGATPLKVKFSAAASSDPDPEDTLSYAWDLDGDGEFDDGTEADVAREYTEAVNVTIRVRVSDDLGHTDVDEITLYPGDKGPPVASISAPVANLEWAIGEEIDYEAAATAPAGETFGSGLSAHWEFRQVHCPDGCHEHAATGSSSSPSGSFTPGQHEFPFHLKLVLTVTDSRGMTDTEAVEIYPRLIEVGVASDPAGIPISIDGIALDEPFSSTTTAGGTVTVAAPSSAQVGGQEYLFSSWSDGGARVHEVTSDDSVDLVAHFVPKPAEEPPPNGGEVKPPPPAPPKTARVRLVSRPPGVKLRLGGVQRKAPFVAQVETGIKTFIAAPKTIRKNGKALRFLRWLKDGRKLGSSPRREFKVATGVTYVAVYGTAAQSPHGGR
ncbi:MAG TPA: PQQ-dependent sugar dehydrogenase [Solirubrobacterales bacterium]|jgi:glucose/arabinose dehydrogenase|nr:PQQ-dependent sugar dehydrogenase [Solirubrobacterales bacterium]